MRALSRKNLWDAVPSLVKHALSDVMGCVPPQVCLGRRFRAARQFVAGAQWWSADRSRDYQLDHLRRICTRAYERTRYYRRVFDAAGFRPQDLRQPEDLEGLPTIDKTIIRDHLDDMCTVSPRSPGVDYVATGGSNGRPLRFYIGSDRSAIEYAYLVSCWQRAGFRLDTPQAVIRGQLVAEDRNGLRHEYDPVLRRHYYSNFHMSDDNMRRYLEHVATIGPCFLHVYPSSAAALTRFIQNSGVPVPRNIVGILAGSENVWQDDRAMVEEVFGVRYFSWYGHSEKLVLAAECEYSANYHVWPTYGFFELLDEEGRSVTTPGQRGEIVGTGFINQVVPFIRYRTGDYATYVGDRCEACGRQHPVLSDVVGRWPQGCLVAEDGAVISMTAFNVHDDTFESINGYQFRQSTPGRATLCVVPVRPLTADERAKLLARVNERLQGQVQVSLEICSELKKTERGKLLRVILHDRAAELGGVSH